jgi:predicted nucleic acid-binding protein
MAALAYPDSSFLVSLYRGDDNHAAAGGFMRRHKLALAFLPLHRVELRNALRLAEARGHVTTQERREYFRQVEEDLRDGFLVHVNVGWADICRRADDLSEQYVAQNGQRTIDWLHVATAVECGQKLFLSFDQRQRGLAEAAGLRVRP